MHLRPILHMTPIALAAALSIVTGAARAGPCTGVSLGTASTTDVTLGGPGSDSCVVSSANPQAGPNGTTSGFGTQFGGGWSLLSKVNADGAISSDPASIDGVGFDVSFTKTSGTTGTWSITSDRSTTFDLVFAMHAANRSGAFLFEDQTLGANAALQGFWEIQWLNNGGRVPGYSNLTLFVRDVEATPVPEPQSVALVLASLGALVWTTRRRAR